MIDATHSAIMKRSDLEEVPYGDAEYIASHVQLSDSTTGKSKFMPAFFATLVAAIGSLNFGFALGYSSPVESGIEHDHKVGISTELFSWFAVSFRYDFLLWANLV